MGACDQGWEYPDQLMRAVHPGEVLREDYLKRLNMSANALAKALHVPATRINDVVVERRGVTPDTAMRLTRGGCPLIFWQWLAYNSCPP